MKTSKIVKAPKKTNEVNDTETQYVTVMTSGSTIHTVKIKRLSPASPMAKMKMLRSGISKSYLEKVKSHTNLDYVKLARLLTVARATLINKKSSQKFNTALSERILSLADLYDYGYEVFEDREKFNQWMTNPNKALGDQVPLDLIDNQFGREEVRNILTRIEYGVYS